MLIAIVAALLEKQILNPTAIAISIAIGAVIGLYLTYRVKMTEMPELVAVLNGLGGGASSLVATATFVSATTALAIPQGIGVVATCFIGTVTLSGSIVAFLKLNGRMSQQPITMPFHNVVTILLFVGILAMAALLVSTPNTTILWVLIGLSIVAGLSLVLPIGGADMPVVISLLNSYSGVAAATTGFALSNNLLIVAGALVGASGIILTKIMCDAMNRSLFNVVFGAFGQTTSAQALKEQKTAKSYSVEDAMMQLETASSVVVVPGYGLAVSRAQHNIRELDEILEKAQIDVKYAIHPVAGRMPGHMNVLLAEANIPYEKQIEMDEINSEFETTDVVLVVGANDVVNPAARDDDTSPIYGMPILDVDKSKTCIVLKRSLSPGFAGIDNDLFYRDNTMMVFGDAKQSLVNLVNQAKENIVTH